MNEKILLIDDEKYILDSLSDVLSDEGYICLTALDGFEGIRLIEQENPDVILLDIWMEDIDGIEVLKRVKSTYPHLPIIMISGHGTIETAVQTTKLGAFDFIEKPISLEKLLILIKNALNYKKIQEENEFLKSNFLKDEIILGNSNVIKKLLFDVDKIAPTDSWVLITGENGSGKELVAKLIHKKSKRANKPFIDVNCAAIPEELIESELFGHEKGSFTGAIEQKKGKFDLANGGTIFLDEIGDMSLRTQSKILRILQEQKFERVGGHEIINVDVRVIAATNKNLIEEIENGKFREDLYYRLNVIPIHVPPLRDRVEDIPILAKYFLNKFSFEHTGRTKEITNNAIELLQKHDWPGNVRELKNLMERLVILVDNDVIDYKAIEKYLFGKNNKNNEGLCNLVDKFDKLDDAVKTFEKMFIEKKIKMNNGNITKTSEMIGVTRRNLYRKMKSLDINWSEL
jgi:two-component system nitrogen regulation response regulator NtrX